METFATLEELEAFWKPLDIPEERARAGVLLDAASNYLRQIAINNGSSLDTRIDEDETGVLKASVATVTMSSVKRAMTTPVDAPPADQWSQSASPYSETIKFSNPSSDIFFKNNELQLIGVGSLAGRSRIGLLRGVR